MAELRIATTLADGLRPLGTAGQRSHQLVAETLREALGDKHASLFAEPVVSPRGDQVDWYSSASGQIQKLSAMTGPDAEQAQAELSRLVSDIKKHAEKLAQSRDENTRRQAETLTNALEIPDESHVYMVGGQPVLTCWSHELDVRAAPTGVLYGLIPGAAAASHAAAGGGSNGNIDETSRAASGFPWLRIVAWLLLAGLILCLFYALLAPCGLWGPQWLKLNRCEAPKVAVHNPQEERIAVLRRDIEGLKDGLADFERSCLVREIDRLNTPPEPKPEPEPEPKPKPEPKKTPPKPKSDLEQGFEKKDVSKLEGCWNLQADVQVRDDTTGALSRLTGWRACFDGNGNGNQTLNFSDGATCTGTPISASFNGRGQLVLKDQKDNMCGKNGSKSMTYYQRELTCDMSKDGTFANCSTKQKIRGRWEQKAKGTKLRR